MKKTLILLAFLAGFFVMKSPAQNQQPDSSTGAYPGPNGNESRCILGQSCKWSDDGMEILCNDGNIPNNLGMCGVETAVMNPKIPDWMLLYHMYKDDFKLAQGQLLKGDIPNEANFWVEKPTSPFDDIEYYSWKHGGWQLNEQQMDLQMVNPVGGFFEPRALRAIMILRASNAIEKATPLVENPEVLNGFKAALKSFQHWDELATNLEKTKAIAEVNELPTAAVNEHLATANLNISRLSAQLSKHLETWEPFLKEPPTPPVK